MSRIKLIEDLKFGDKVVVKTGKRKIQEGFVWKIGKTYLLIALNNGKWIKVEPWERKIVWKKPRERWLWEDL